MILSVHYWDELKKVFACFGDSCKDFDIVEDSDFAAELIKEGFTLEFMKNALIKPVLSLKNKDLLLDWWKQVEEGKEDVPLPPESEIFKSESYSSFIFVYFKMATEVNVFAHLGRTLMKEMKESLFSDVVDVDSDDEEGGEQNENTNESQTLANNNQVETSEASNGESNDVIKDESNGNLSKEEESNKDSEAPPEQPAPKPKTITSMYGKVYTLKE